MIAKAILNAEVVEGFAEDAEKSLFCDPLRKPLLPLRLKSAFPPGSLISRHRRRSITSENSRFDSNTTQLVKRGGHFAVLS